MQNEKFHFVFLLFIRFKLLCTGYYKHTCTGGEFKMKDAANSFLTLSQSTGQVNIEKTLRLGNTTSSSLGVIFKGTDRFIHNYGGFNTFIGINSGNFSMSGGYNTAIGYRSFYSNTAGYFNTAVGEATLYSNTTGVSNTALGWNSLNSNTTGNLKQQLWGRLTLRYNTTGYYNTAVGATSLQYNTTEF